MDVVSFRLLKILRSRVMVVVPLHRELLLIPLCDEALAPPCEEPWKSL
jgi:hypothetical protein